MRAMVLQQPGEALQLQTLPMPKVKPGQILLKVSACGICRTDLHVVDGELSEAKLPIIPGHQIVGYAEKVGEGVDRFFSWAARRRAMAGWELWSL